VLVFELIIIHLVHVLVLKMVLPYLRQKQVFDLVLANLVQVLVLDLVLTHLGQVQV